MFCIHIINFSQIPPLPFMPNFISSFKKKSKKTDKQNPPLSLCCLDALGCWAVHWRLVKLPRMTLWKKPDSPPSSCQSLAKGEASCPPPLSMMGFVFGLSLCRSHTFCHNSLWLHECNCLLCPENTAPCRHPPPLAPTVFCPLPHSDFSPLGRDVI